MSHQQDANDAKLATAEQENAAVLARLSKMEAELKNLKEKTWSYQYYCIQCGKRGGILYAIPQEEKDRLTRESLLIFRMHIFI